MEEIRAGTTDGPNDSGYFSAGIDIKTPTAFDKNAWHHHAIIVARKSRKGAERLRDAILAALRRSVQPWPANVGEAIDQFAAELAVLADENLNVAKRRINEQLLSLFCHLAEPYRQAAQPATPDHAAVVEALELCIDVMTWEHRQRDPKFKPEDATPESAIGRARTALSMSKAPQTPSHITAQQLAEIICPRSFAGPKNFGTQNEFAKELGRANALAKAETILALVHEPVAWRDKAAFENLLEDARRLSGVEKTNVATNQAWRIVERLASLEPLSAPPSSRAEVVARREALKLLTNARVREDSEGNEVVVLLQYEAKKIKAALSQDHTPSDLADAVARAASAFCEELQEDADGVPQIQLQALHDALEKWETASPLSSRAEVVEAPFNAAHVGEQDRQTAEMSNAFAPKAPAGDWQVVRAAVIEECARAIEKKHTNNVGIVHPMALSDAAAIRALAQKKE